MSIPTSLLFSNQHLWAKPADDGHWLAGITEYAQDLLGDIVFVDAPSIGQQLVAGTACGLVESVKTGSDLHALVDGEVLAINQDAIDAPETINDDPYETWIFKFKATDNNLADKLLNAQQYQELISQG